MVKDEVAKMDYKILEDTRMAKETLQMILKSKEELDDFRYFLELLSNPRFRKNLEKGLEDTAKISQSSLQSNSSERDR